MNKYYTVKKCKDNKTARRAFSMIELIFVIVILGVLAAIAIPKINASKDDALAVTMFTNINQVVDEVQNYYASTGKTDFAFKNIAAPDSPDRSYDISRPHFIVEYGVDNGLDPAPSSGRRSKSWLFMTKEVATMYGDFVKYCVALTVGYMSNSDKYGVIINNNWRHNEQGALQPGDSRVCDKLRTLIEKKYKSKDAGFDMYEIPFINQIEDSILYPH
jgi:transformation system protein